jgi:uncharacterized protein YecA (UPF0149 family)
MQINTAHKQKQEQNHIFISIDAGKAFKKIQHPFLIKALMKLEIEGMYFNITKAVYNKHSQHHTKWGKTETTSSKSGMRQWCLLSPLLFNKVLE